MTEQTKRLILQALANARGDDYPRAELEFRGYSHEQMNQAHGNSGRTRAETLERYRQTDERYSVAIADVAAIKAAS